MNELKMKTENIKEEVTPDMENLRKKIETKTQNTVEVQSSRLEQMSEDRMSELKDKTEIKDKTGRDPKWQLGHRCRLHELHESGTLLRCWRHTLLR
jgi:hypothetical protein